MEELPDVQAATRPEPHNAREILTVFFKHKYKILAVFAVTVASVATITVITSPVYRAESTILVKFGREYLYRPEVSDRTPVVSVNQEEAINSEINIITSPDLIEKVIHQVGLEKIYPELQENLKSDASETAVAKFTKNLTVEVLKKTNVLRVSFEHSNPQLAATCVNLLVAYYKERHFQVYNGPESQFLAQQLAIYRDRLNSSEATIQGFKRRKQVYSLEEQRALLLKQRVDLDSGLKSTRTQINGLKERLKTMTAKLASLSQGGYRYTPTERDRIVVDARAQLVALQLKERELLEKYPENNRLVQKVRSDIAMITEYIQQQEKEISDKVRTGSAVYQETEKESLVTQGDLDSALAREKTIEDQLVQLDAQIGSLDASEKPLQDLQRELATNDKNYRNYLDRFEEARISEDVNRKKYANLNIIQAAVAPAKPVRPMKLLNLLLGLLLGTFTGIGYAVICEFVNQGLSTPDQAEKKLRLPVLATITFKE